MGEINNIVKILYIYRNKDRIIHMEKSIAAIEVTPKSIKLVIGNVIDGNVYVIYALTKPLQGVVDSHGNIIDPNALTANIKSLNTIVDSSARLKIQVSDCILIIPSFGLEVKLFKQFTAVSSEELKISYFDLKNCYNQQKNTLFVEGCSILDIIPQLYDLGNDNKTSRFPLGQLARDLTISGVVHFLPTEMIDSYQNAVEKGGINVKKLYASCFTASELLSSLDLGYRDYFLVDIGSEETTVSLVGGNTVAKCTHIFWGGNDITEKIMTTFNINYNEAEKCKVLYGLDRRELSFKAPICQTEDQDGNVIKHYLDELNPIIKNELDKFAKSLNETMDALLGKRFSNEKTLPLFFIGGGSQLLGLVEYIEPKIPNNIVKVVTSRTIGARDPEYINCLGAIYAYNKYPRIIDDRATGLSGLARKDK